LDERAIEATDGGKQLSIPLPYEQHCVILADGRSPEMYAVHVERHRDPLFISADPPESPASEAAS
jgi:hypothetical protein